LHAASGWHEQHPSRRPPRSPRRTLPLRFIMPVAPKGRGQPPDPRRGASLTSVIPLVLVVHPSGPAGYLPERLAPTWRLGDGLRFASADIGTRARLTLAMTRPMGRGGAATHLPFAGSAPALTSLVAGRTMAMRDAPVCAAALVRDGRTRAIAVTHGERLGLLPHVQTTVERGVRNLIASTGRSLVMDAATPAERVRRFAAEVDSIRHGGAPEGFAAVLRAEAEKRGRLVRETGAKIDD
jgi:tripartite-type tricarboxylate transporter receptor subunit TctC